MALGIVAHRKDLISLDAWLSEALRTEDAAGSGHAFASAALAYIRDKLLSGNSSRVGIGGGSSTVNALSAEHAATLFRELGASPLPSPLCEELRALYKLCVQAKPKLRTLFNPEVAASAEPGQTMLHDVAFQVPGTVPDMNDRAGGTSVTPSVGTCGAELMLPTASPLNAPVTCGCGVASALSAASLSAFCGASGLPGMPGGQDIHFAAGIEEEANSYFQRIYTGASSIDDVVALLKRFQASGNPREQQVSSHPSPLGLSPVRSSSRTVPSRALACLAISCMAPSKTLYSVWLLVLVLTDLLVHDS